MHGLLLIIIGVLLPRGAGASAGVRHMLPGLGVLPGRGAMTHIGHGDPLMAGVGAHRGDIILRVRAGARRHLRDVLLTVTTVRIRVLPVPPRPMPVGQQAHVPAACTMAPADLPQRADPLRLRLPDPPTALRCQAIPAVAIGA